MEGADRDQKTEEPTEKRLADAAKTGDTRQSRDLGVALVMAAGGGWLYLFGNRLVAECARILKSGLSFDVRDIESFSMQSRALRLLVGVSPAMTALFGLCMLAAIAGPFAIGSGRFRGAAAAFKATRLNPLTGFSRMFGAQAWLELAKSIVKSLALGACGFAIVIGDLPKFAGLARSDIADGAAAAGASFVQAVVLLAIALAAIAAIDVPLQFAQYRRRHRMTKHEVKEELRQSEGTPELKQAQRRRQYEMSMHSARKALTDASVVITNPVHFAIALRYLPGKDSAPIVVARGRGETARAIRDLARENDVPTLEYPQLARAIYYSSRAGQAIAEDLYIAVATILAFVFNLDRAMAEGAPQPEVSVPASKCFDAEGRVAP